MNALTGELFGNLEEARVIFGKAGASNTMNVARTLAWLSDPSEYTRKATNPSPLAAAGVQGELKGNAPTWQPNKSQNTKELAELQS
jgi:hypothetical protein